MTPDLFCVTGKTEIENFESLSDKDKVAFILKRNPRITFRKPFSYNEIEKWPNGFWCYKLDNGWIFCRTCSRQETIDMFKSKTEGK